MKNVADRNRGIGKDVSWEPDKLVGNGKKIPNMVTEQCYSLL